MGFPAVIGPEALTQYDFFRLELQFARTVIDFFPGLQVQFITHGLGENDPAPSGALADEMLAGLSRVRQGGKPVVDAGAAALFLPFWSQDDLVAVAILTGSEWEVHGRYSEDWLLERARLVTREFFLLKRWAQDPASGLLNAASLRQELDLLLGLPGAGAGAGGAARSLLLIEVTMRAQHAGQALRNISRTAAYLDSLLGELTSIYHLGAGVFALIWRGEDLDEVQKLGATLLGKLKRQGTQKVHLGIAAFEDSAQSLAGRAPVTGTQLSPCSTGVEFLPAMSSRVDSLLDKAWDALGTARQRGAFALCIAPDAEAGEHLLAPLAPELLAQVKRLWQGENQFSIIYLQKDLAAQVQEGSAQSLLQPDGGSVQSSLDEGFPGRVRALVGEGAGLQVLDANRALICLPGIDEQVAADWAGGLANRILQLKIGTFSMGIASYPCPGFRKADIPQNAKKALVHTQFFGAGTITSFSGVSLNISGDVYYNAGDLVSAIREYRLGLNLNPDNVNLLNSLGVIYAQIDSHAKAIPLFAKAIALNPKDFMARYNLGFAYLCSGEQDKALHCFEQAAKIDDSYFDLLLQLGQLYCQRGQYKEAVRVLTKADKSVSAQAAVRDDKPWERCEPWLGERHELGHGLVYRYLGEAYKEIGQNREAMTYLQRAARYNSRDSEALSQLGELYATENQGLDIALAFCRQALEIESGRAPHWYRMGKVLFCRGEWDEALEAVQHCLAMDAKHLEALMLKAAIHEKCKQAPLARLVYERVLALDGTHARAAKALKKINQSRR